MAAFPASALFSRQQIARCSPASATMASSDFPRPCIIGYVLAFPMWNRLVAKVASKRMARCGTIQVPTILCA